LVAVSPDGKLLASGSGFVPTVVLWDVETGRQVRTIALRSDVEDIAFAPDGQTLAISTLDGELSLWGPGTGGALRRFAAGPGNSSAIVFSPDGTTIATGGDDGVIRLWDMAGLQPMRPLDTKAGVLSSLAFAADGRSLVFAAAWSVAVWDLASGTAVHSPGEQQEIVAYSPDGKSVLIGTGWGAVQLWDPQAGPQRHSLINPALSPDTVPEGFSTANAFFTNLPSVAFSPKGDLVAVSSESGIKLWSTLTGGIVRAWSRDPGGPYSLAFSPDGKLLAGGGYAGAKAWDIASGRVVSAFTGHTGFVFSTAFSADGRTIFANGGENSVALWDVASGRVLGTVTRPAMLGVFAVSPDRKVLAAGGLVNNVDVWDAASRVHIRALAQKDPDGSTSWVESVALSPKRDLIAAGTSNGYVIVWNLKTGQTVAPPIYGINGYTDPVAFSPDGSVLAVATSSPDSPAELWDTKSWHKQRALTGRSGTVWTLAFSPDGKSIATGGADGSLVLWDAASGRPLRSFPPNAQAIETVAFSPDGRVLASGGDDMQVRLWDVASGRPLQVLAGNSGRINAVAFAPGGRLLVTGGADGTTRVWDVSTGHERACLVWFDDGSSIAVTPEGFFDSSSAAAEENLNARIGDRVFGISSFRDTFYRPDLVRRSLAGEDISKYGDVAQVKLSPEIELVDLPVTTTDATLTVAAKLTDGGGGIGSVRVFEQGTVILQDDTQSGLTRSYTVPLASGDNRLRVAASNASGDMWSMVDGQVTSTQPAANDNAAQAKGTLHAIVIGINDFPASLGANLTLAVPDANLFADTLQAKAAPLFKSLDIERLVTSDVTDRQHVIDAIKAMQKRVGPDDAFVFYVASHGIVANDEYYLVTSNVGTITAEALSTDAISRRELTDLLANIPTTHKAVFIDTCDAGGLGGADQQAISLSGMDAKTAATIISRQVGLTMLMAAETNQQALAGYRNHGLFTYALNEGLEGKAANPATGLVTSDRLATYVDGRVPAIAHSLSPPQTQQPTDSQAGQPFAVAKVAK
jgi:WD40 repeat protein